MWRETVTPLSPDDRAKLSAALLAHHIQHTAIVRWLEQRHVTTNKTTVARHRPKRDGSPMDCITCRLLG